MRLVVVEAKAVRSVKPEMGASLNRLARAISRYKVEKYVVHLPPQKKARKELSTLSPGVKAVPITAIDMF